MSRRKPTDNEDEQNKKLSLHPLTFDEALAGLLATDPPPKKRTKKSRPPKESEPDMPEPDKPAK